MREVLNIDAARRNIRRHQHTDISLLKRLQRRLTRPLRLIAMDGMRRDVRLLQLAGHTVGAVLCAGKHQCRRNIHILQQMNQQLRLIGAVDVAHLLADGLNR